MKIQRCQCVYEREVLQNAFFAKKRAIENVNAVERSKGPLKPLGTRAANKPSSATIPAKKDKRGVSASKLDTDVAFLKSIASKKRRGGGGKQKINLIEFNNLKISKPEPEQQEPEEKGSFY